METLDKSFIKIAEIDLIDVPGMVLTRERLLSEAQDGYHKLLEQFKGGKETQFGENALQIQWGMGRAFRSLGDIERELGEPGPSEKDLTDAIKVLKDLNDKAPTEIDYQRDLARACHGKGETLRLQGDFTGSEEYFDKAIKLREEIQHEPDDIRSLAASVYSRASLLAQFRSRFADAETGFEGAIDLMTGYKSEPLEGKAAEPAAGEHLLLLARYKDNLGRLKLRQGRAEEALALNREVQGILKSLPAEMQGRPGVRWQRARYENNQGAIHYAQNFQSQKAGAEQEARAAVERMDLARKELAKLVDEFPEVPQYRRELAAVCQNLAEIVIEDALDALDKNNLPEARRQFDRSHADSLTALKMIEGITTAARRLSVDGLNQAFATFDLHLREAWVQLVRETPGGAPQNTDMSPQGCAAQ